MGKTFGIIAIRPALRLANNSDIKSQITSNIITKEVICPIAILSVATLFSIDLPVK